MCVQATDSVTRGEQEAQDSAKDLMNQGSEVRFAASLLTSFFNSLFLTSSTLTAGLWYVMLSSN